MRHCATLISYIIAFVFATNANSQELICSVNVQSASIQGTNKQIYENMRNALNDFMREQKWTNDKYESNERIECSLNFNITEQISSNEFKGTLTVQSRRPVWGSAYTTTMLNVMDKDIQFRYNEGQPMTFNESSFDQDNLIPLIAYYVYVILGIDYDSFSSNGGAEYWQKAEQICNQAQKSTFAGWKSYDGTQNRYWLINNALDDNHKIFHTQLYNYHRMGLDKMSESVENGREQILGCIDQLRKVKQNVSRNAYLLGLFFTAKSDELVSIFSEAPDIEKSKAMEYLSAADPGNINKYQKIKK